jgi:hypothetical protein
VLAIVLQLLDDFEDAEAVNEQLSKMGHTIGKRLADDFFARARGAKCRTFEQAMQTTATVSAPRGMVGMRSRAALLSLSQSK